MSQVPHPDFSLTTTLVDEAMRYLASVVDANFLTIVYVGETYALNAFYTGTKIEVQNKSLGFAIDALVKQMKEIDEK